MFSRIQARLTNRVPHISILRCGPRAQARPLSSASAPKARIPNVLRSATLVRALQAIILVTAMITMLGADDTNTRFERVGHNMMCACSCGQILLECNHVGCPDSARMINELHTQVATGASDRVIMDWFVAKYGAIILASPIRGGFDNVAWITPIALFLLAIVGTAVLVRVWRARSLRTATASAGIQVPGLNRTQADLLRDRIRRETEY